MNDSVFSTKNDEEIDSINSYFECITECSIVEGHQECITRCLEIHLKGGNQYEEKKFSTKENNFKMER